MQLLVSLFSSSHSFCEVRTPWMIPFRCSSFQIETFMQSCKVGSPWSFGSPSHWSLMANCYSSLRYLQASLKSTPSAEEKFMRHTFCCARYKQCFVFVGSFWEGSALWWSRSVLRYFQHPKKFISLCMEHATGTSRVTRGHATDQT